MTEENALRTLWNVAVNIIEQVDPIVRSALSGTTSSQCTRCPLCALNAALGERSDEFTSMLMSQGWEALSLVQRFLDEHDLQVATPGSKTGTPAADGAKSGAAAAYEPIAVTID